MIITLELSPDVERALETEAAHYGMSASQLAQQLIAETLSTRERIEAQQDLEDVEEARRVLAESDPSQRRTLNDLRRALGR